MSQPHMQYSTNERDRTIHAEPANMAKYYYDSATKMKKVGNAGACKIFFLDHMEACYNALPYKNKNKKKCDLEHGV